MPVETSEIEGFLLEPEKDGALRILAGDHILSFRKEDVLQTDRLAVPNGLDIRNCTAVRLTLAHGARLDRAELTVAAKHMNAKGRLPFSLAVRPTSAQVEHAPKFEKLERTFLEKNGLA